MGLTICGIFAAYILGEFIVRPLWTHKRSGVIWTALARGAIVTAAACLLLGTLRWQLLLGILAATAATAAIERHNTADTVLAFAAEQCAKLALLLGLACLFPSAAREGWWVRNTQADVWKWHFAALSCISGLIVCVQAGGALIGRTIRRFADEIRETDIIGLTQGGQYIGWLERILVFLLVLINQPSGIGFLITAKSILRFGEIKETSQRKVAEYIIIGTFASFAWALFISVLTQRTIQYWLQR